MTRVKKSPFKRLRKNRKAASPAISMVIITAVTIVLVIVAGNYAYQTLERQRGASEFETVKRSFLAFDDAVRDVAWDRGASRSARFTVNYGRLELIPNTLPLVINVTGYPDASYSTNTSYVRYRISTNYITFGDGYESYILGDSKTVVSASTEGFGRALIKQESGWVSILLNYRVRALREGPPTLVNSTLVNYVDILIIRINVTKWSMYMGDFDLVAKNIGITTVSRGPYPVTGNNCTVSVSLGGSSSSVLVSLVPNGTQAQVVFNFVIADVQIST